MQWRKQAASLGSALPDSVKSEAAVTPSAPVVVENKSAPGRTGPRGLSPRTTYSRVNTGAASNPSVGEQAKATPPRGLEFLPKVAHKEISMASTMTRPLLQDLVKQAMEGTVSKVDITAEAARQLGVPVEQRKVASAKKLALDHVPSEVCEKYAAALEHLAKTAAIQLSADAVGGVGPGEGPNAIGVMAAQSSEENIDAGQGGQATPQNVPPKDPPTESFDDSNSPPNAMSTNIDMAHAEQPEDPMHNESAPIAAQKQASDKLAQKNLQHVLKMTGSKAPIEKGASLLEKNLAVLGLKKTAEDAINPAQISAGPASAQGSEAPEGASAAEAGPAPPEPSDVNSQKRLISSNDAAINYTKRESKADPKKDLGHILEEPALSATHDRTLHEVWDNTDQAGAKIAAAKLTKTAAAHALLLKLAQEQEEEKEEEAKKKKEKESQMGGLGTPQGQSNFNATTMGGM